MRLLLVDDDPEIHRFVKTVLPLDQFEITGVHSAEEAMPLIDEGTVDLALVDWRLPGKSGLELCDYIRAQPHGNTIYLLLFTAHHNPDSLAEVLSHGADDYLIKPIELQSFRIRMGIARRHAEKLLAQRAMQEKLKALEEERNQDARFHDLIGVGRAMKHVFDLLRDVARMETSVLITGETGTGKELAARAIHEESPRRKGPFIAVNCGGLAENLIAGQLFGHRRGAFTGAVSNQKGVFEAAAGGTLFLDEIGDLPLDLQPNFLRVLENRELTRLGETRPIPVNVRVVAATHRDLEERCRQGLFRRDLLYRIQVAPVHLPPLRERPEDITHLVLHFLRSNNVFDDRTPPIIQQEAMHHLLRHPWPGNVRELRNVVDYAVIRGRGNQISAKDLPPGLTAPHVPEPKTQQTLTPTATDPIQTALREQGDNPIAAAQALGLKVATFYRKSPATFKRLYLEANARNQGDMLKTAEELGLSRATLYRKLKELQLD